MGFSKKGLHVPDPVANVDVLSDFLLFSPIENAQRVQIPALKRLLT